MKKLIFILAFGLIGFVANAQTADDLFTNGDYAKAAEAYQAIVKTDSTNVTALRRLAFSYSNLQNTDALVEFWYKKALYHAPNDVASNYYLGLYYKERLSSVKTEFKPTFIAKAKTYLGTAAKLGSDEAKQELANLK